MSTSPMLSSSHLLTLLLLLLLLLLFLIPHSHAHDSSLDSIISPTHKTLLSTVNVLVFGNANLARVAVKGYFAVQNDAEIANFDLARDKPCDKSKPALTVGGRLSARMGTISGGYIVLGRSSQLHHTVKLPCTTRVENHDPVRNGDIDFDELKGYLARESSEYCVTTTTGTTNVTGDAVYLTPEEHSYSCHSSFRVTSSQLRLARKLVNNGTDYYRNVVIIIGGSRAELRDFHMEGFNPSRTLIVHCGIYGHFGWYNARIQGSVFALTTSFTAMDTVVNGSLIVGGLRGSLAALDVPYVTC